MLRFMEYLTILEGTPDSWLTPSPEPLNYLYKKYKAPTSWGNINTGEMPPVAKSRNFEVPNKKAKNRQSIKINGSNKFKNQ